MAPSDEKLLYKDKDIISIYMHKEHINLHHSSYATDVPYAHASDFPHVERSCEINPSHMVFMIFHLTQYI